MFFTDRFFSFVLINLFRLKDIMKTMIRILHFYRDGFRQMTWGRVLWAIILLKLFILFAVLRVFFFQPFLKGDDSRKQQTVAKELIDRAT